MKKNTIKRVGICFGGILIIGLICIAISFGNDLATLNSLKQINSTNKNYPFYSMTYHGDYRFDDYLKVGSETKLEYAEFILKNTTHDFIKSVPTNCSSFTAITPEGDRLFARNLDTRSAMPLFLETDPSSGYQSMSMVNLEVLGYKKDQAITPFSRNGLYLLTTSYIPLEGMNESGLAISVLTAGTSKASIKKDKVSINDCSLIRMVLDKASTVEEAVSMIEDYNMSFNEIAYPSHFMIADATGASVVIEYIDGEMQTVYNDKAYQIVTNFILYHNTSGGFGLDRYNRIDEKLSETEGILTEKEAIQLLSENTIVGDEQWSAVYNLTQKKAYICVGQDYETIYEFNLK